MSDFQEVEQARRTLGLSESATLEDIKQCYRKLALKYHPDRCRQEKRKESEELFKKITRSKDILLTYCAGYRYSFKEKDVKRNAIDKESYEHLKRFYDGWWGTLDL